MGIPIHIIFFLFLHFYSRINLSRDLSEYSREVLHRSGEEIRTQLSRTSPSDGG